MKTLKELREEHHLTQKQLADELGVNIRTIGKWEHNEVNIPKMTKKYIAQYFDINENNIDW